MKHMMTTIRHKEPIMHEEPIMLDGCNESADGRAQGVCTVLFEASTLQTLGRSLTRWMMTHPRYHPLAFSHTFETRLEPGANLAGPRPLPVYTGVLLVRLTPPTGEQTRRELPGRYEPALPG